MSSIPVDKFLDCLRRSALVSEDQLTPALASFRQTASDPQDGEQLAKALIEAKLITQWQADKLIEGKSSGFTLGPYKLLRLLGAGGMSTVYLAEHTLMQCLRAIKVLPAARVNDSSYLQRFRQEAIAAGRLSHQNIVQTYDIGQHKIHHYIVMEYVDGKDLQNVVKDTGLPDYETVANYIRQAADGLAYAHQAGLVHRDIKPANLLVDTKGTVKLLDLGLARFVDDNAPSLTIAHDENVLGTADYLAPEQAVYSHGVDNRADIYSLGCTMYFLLTGHPPFPNGTLQQRIHAHQSKQPASIYTERPDAPQALVDVCERMMAKSAEARYQSATEVSNELRAWLNARAQGLGGGNGPRVPGGKPLPPPRRGAKTATMPPPRPTRTGADSDTIADMDRETIKGPSARPLAGAEARKSDSNPRNRPGDSGKAGQSDKLRPGGETHPGANGAPRRSGPQAVVNSATAAQNAAAGSGGIGGIPQARSLDPMADDPTSALFVPPGVTEDTARQLLTKRGKKKPAAPPLPKWFWFAMGGGLLVAIVIIIVVIITSSRGNKDAPGGPAPPPQTIRQSVNSGAVGKQSQ